jgi:hypothetical protein
VLRAAYNDEEALQRRLTSLTNDNVRTIEDWHLLTRKKQAEYPGLISGIIGKFMAARNEAFPKKQHTPESSEESQERDKRISSSTAYKTNDALYLEKNPYLSLRDLEFVVSGQIHRRVKIIGRLGDGGYGTVYLINDVTTQDTHRYAMKVVKSKHVEFLQEGVHQVKILSHKCKYIAELYDSYILPKENEFDTDTLFIIMVQFLFKN